MDATKKTRREKDTKMRKNKTTKKLTKIFFKGQLLLWAGVLSFNFLACQRNPEEGYITATGTVEARTSRISPRGSGRVLRIQVEEGQAVKPGDLLVELEHDYLDLQLKQAEANQKQAEAQLALLKKGARAEEIEQAQQQLKQAEISLNQARVDAERYKNLYARGSVTKRQLEEAENRLALSEAQYHQAEEMLRKLKKLARPEEIKAAEARVAQAEAAVELLRKNIEDCLVLCPVAGVVTARAVEPGELVNPSSVLVTVSKLDPVYLWVYLSEVEVGKIRLGQKAEVSVDSFPGQKFTGQVVYISPEAEFTPKNIQTKEDGVKLVFRVKVEIPNPEGRLKPGLPAEALLKVL